MLCKFSLLLGIRIFKRENPYFHSKILRKSVDISATFLASLFTNKASFQSFSMLLKYTIKLHSLLHNHTTPKSNSFLNYLLIGIIYVPIIYDTLQPKQRLRSCHQIWNSLNLTPKCPVFQVSPPK